MFPGERPIGVRVPESQLRSGLSGRPNSVSNVAPLVPYAIEYYDENGQQHTAVAYKMGDVVYLDLNSERWAASMKPATEYISKAVKAEHDARTSTEVPIKDLVDVLAGEISGKDK